jgi:predicted RNase H-like HicB family nuclease
MKYLIVIEKTDTGYSAYTPDIQGCVATGATRDEVERTMREAIQFHIEGMTEEGLEIPEPRCYSTYMEAGVSKSSR